jgi:PIN domain nuclease of toxin-antitoxin system
VTRLLLDTHTLLWWLQDPALLKDDARVAIAHPHTKVFVSFASILEIVIKQSIGKLKLTASPEDYLEACHFRKLPYTLVHAGALRHLPNIPKDPFDRMLVAQAQAEGMTLVSRDPVMERYQVPLIAA